MASFAYCLAGRFPEALDAGAAALELTADRPDRGAGFQLESPRGLGLLWRGVALAVLGRPVEALVMIDETEAFLRGRRFKETFCWHAWGRLFALRAAGADVGGAEVAIA